MDPSWIVGVIRSRDCCYHPPLAYVNHKLVKSLGASTLNRTKPSSYIITMCVLFAILLHSVVFVDSFQPKLFINSEIMQDNPTKDSINNNITEQTLQSDPSQNKTIASSQSESVNQNLSLGLNGLPNTQNGTTASSDRKVIISIISVNSVVFVIGFFGNAIVILVILKYTRSETVTDIYILNLAMADLMFTTGLIFLNTTMSLERWVFGNLMCKLYMATTSLNQFASSLLLVVMSFDRFLAVCHPIYAQQFRRIRRAKMICLCIWIICLVLMSPIFAFAKLNPELTCAIFWPEYKSFNCEVAFTLYSFAIGFAGPLLLIAGFYTCVIRKLRIAASRPISLSSSRRTRTRECANRRIEYLVIGIICTYTICWLPYWIAQLCVSFSTGESSPVFGFYEIFLVATSLSYTNSALNPILYAFLSDNFKRRCSEILQLLDSFKWCESTGCSSSLSTATTAYEHSEISRPESRQAVLLNDSVGNRLFIGPMTNNEIITGNIMEGNFINRQQAKRNRNAQNNNNSDNSNHNKVNLADGSVYCGERRKSVVFSASTINSKGEDSDTSSHCNIKSNDKCQDV